MKNFLKALLALLAAAAALLGCLMLLSEDQPGEGGYVTIYDDANEEENG